MKNHNYFKGLLFALTLIALFFTTPARAFVHSLYVTNIDTVKVDNEPVAFSSPISPGNNRNLTILQPIVGAKAVSVQVTWGISISQWDIFPPPYPQNNVPFSASTSIGAPVDSLTVTPPTCSFASWWNTCVSTVTFTTPNVTENLSGQLKIEPPEKFGVHPYVSFSYFAGKKLFINFTVNPQETKKDTALTVPNPQCFLYNASTADLTATLTESLALGGNPITGRVVNFSVDSNPIGASTPTDTGGNAFLTYNNISNLAVGDYNLYAEFPGDVVYNGSNSSATLGISYNFVGFQQPINADGTSIFGGRVIPIKIKLTDANLQPVTDAKPTVWLTQVSPATALGTYLEAASSVSSADTDNIMRYNATEDKYIYNWDATSLTNGTWYVIVDLGDSHACSKGPYYTTITVNKKKGK